MLEEIDAALSVGFEHTDKNALVTLYGRVFGSYAGLDLNCKCRYEDAYRLLNSYMKKQRIPGPMVKPLEQSPDRIPGPMLSPRRWKIKAGQEHFCIGTMKRGAITKDNATDDNIDFVLSLSKEYEIYFEKA